MIQHYIKRLLKLKPYHKIDINAYGEPIYLDENNLLHRENGPALVHSEGTIAYYRHGKLHRTDGPARIFINGHKEYFQNGEYHRTDGPAVIFSNKNEVYYILGELLTKQEYLKIGGKLNY